MWNRALMTTKADPIERFTFVLGPCAFVAIVLVGVAGLIWNWDNLKLADFLAAIAAGAGLLAVGHGLHRMSRMRRDDS